MSPLDEIRYINKKKKRGEKLSNYQKWVLGGACGPRPDVRGQCPLVRIREKIDRLDEQMGKKHPLIEIPMCFRSRAPKTKDKKLLRLWDAYLTILDAIEERVAVLNEPVEKKRESFERKIDALLKKRHKIQKNRVAKRRMR